MVVVEHIEEEELWFSQVNAKLSAEERAELEAQVAAAKANAPVRPHPMAPQHPGLASILHPLTGAVERGLGM